MKYFFRQRFVFTLTRESSWAYIGNTYQQMRGLPAPHINLVYVSGTEFLKIGQAALGAAIFGQGPTGLFASEQRSLPPPSLCSLF